MSNLPTKYKWLDNEAAPHQIVEAITMVGKDKVPATGNHILQTWATEMNINPTKDYDADSVSWNGLFIGLLTKRSGWTPPTGYLWTLNWNMFGSTSAQPMLGDLLTFIRSSGGAAGFYVGEDKAAYHILGARDANAVTVHRLDKRKLYSSRRPPYTTLPINVRKILLTVGGELV